MWGIIITYILLTGCSTTTVYRGHGIDQIPRSPCSRCEQEPFYINGQFITNKIKKNEDNQ